MSAQTASTRWPVAQVAQEFPPVPQPSPPWAMAVPGAQPIVGGQGSPIGAAARQAAMVVADHPAPQATPALPASAFSIPRQPLRTPPSAPKKSNDPASCETGSRDKAEREGFEPSKQFPAYAISSRVPSASRTPLRLNLKGTSVSVHPPPSQPVGAHSRRGGTPACADRMATMRSARAGAWFTRHGSRCPIPTGRADPSDSLAVSAREDDAHSASGG